MPGVIMIKARARPANEDSGQGDQKRAPGGDEPDEVRPDVLRLRELLFAPITNLLLRGEPTSEIG